MRAIYRELPRTTVQGMAARFGVTLDEARAALLGRCPAENLIQRRIDEADAITKRTGAKPTLEPRLLRAPPRPADAKPARRPTQRQIDAQRRREALARRGPRLVGRSAQLRSIAAAAARAAKRAAIARGAAGASSPSPADDSPPAT